MKLNKRSIFFMVAFFFVLFVFCSAYQEKMEVSKTQGEEIIKKMILAAGMDAKDHIEKMKTLADKIICMKGKIAEHFKAGQKSDIEAIADLYGKNAIFITPYYKKIQGKDNVARLWSMAREKAMKIAAEKKGEMILKVKTTHIFLTEAIGEKEIEIEGKKESYDCVAYVMSEVRIIIKEMGERVQNETYLTLLPLMHRTACPWEH